jgi:hypothetical protein
LSPGRRPNWENIRRCQRTIMVLLLLFLESIKIWNLYLLILQSNAGGSQGGAAYLVRSEEKAEWVQVLYPHFRKIDNVSPYMRMKPDSLWISSYKPLLTRLWGPAHFLRSPVRRDAASIPHPLIELPSSCLRIHAWIYILGPAPVILGVYRNKIPVIRKRFLRRPNRIEPQCARGDEEFGQRGEATCAKASHPNQPEPERRPI